MGDKGQKPAAAPTAEQNGKKRGGDLLNRKGFRMEYNEEALDCFDRHIQLRVKKWIWPGERKKDVITIINQGRRCVIAGDWEACRCRPLLSFSRYSS
ncbi:MAG: hypothetical protein ACK518_03215 [bacterium]